MRTTDPTAAPDKTRQNPTPARAGLAHPSPSPMCDEFPNEPTALSHLPIRVHPCPSVANSLPPLPGAKRTHSPRLPRVFLRALAVPSPAKTCHNLPKPAQTCHAPTRRRKTRPEPPTRCNPLQPPPPAQNEARRSPASDNLPAHTAPQGTSSRLSATPLSRACFPCWFRPHPFAKSQPWLTVTPGRGGMAAMLARAFVATRRVAGAPRGEGGRPTCPGRSRPPSTTTSIRQPRL
jgi:hypothetical protein